MESISKSTLKLLPGIIASFCIAFLSLFIENLMPIPFIGASIISIFIGIIVNNIIFSTKLSHYNNSLKSGTKFTSKKLLRLAIILLGASLSISTILHVGRLSLFVMCFTLLTCFGVGHFIGKWLKINWKLSNMISAGTGICGGSAIAAMAPVINAKDKDIAYAMSATFLFDIAMIVLFPIMGKYFNLSDIAYGLWAGTAVNDTSSVVAAGYAFSESAGDFATMVKLTRTLSIIPTVFIFAFINIRIKKKQLLNETNVENSTNNVKINYLSLFPWFICGFLALALINSTGIISSDLSQLIKTLSRFFMVSALAAIGLNTNFKDITKLGIAPMLHGFIISALVVVVSILCIFLMGLI